MDATVLCVHPRKQVWRRYLRRRHQRLGSPYLRAQEWIGPGIFERYKIDRLEHFEVYDTAYQAIQREKNIKHWPRSWKTRLIGEKNDMWRDLYDEII